MNQRYCIITPAYNEEANLERLYESVSGQTVRPVLWVIVNDGSNDRTGAIITSLASQADYIIAVQRTRETVATYYSRKVLAFDEGYRKLASVGPDYEFLGNLDADISLPSDYYESILSEFSANPKLGVAGGAYGYVDPTEKVMLRRDTVPGSILMFRRACYEAIGGYLPLRYGAEDTLACVMARMADWQTECFLRYKVTQHRVVGTAGNTTILRARFRQGLSEYDIGYHPLFSFAKFIRRFFRERPWALAALARYVGRLCGPFVVRDRICPESARIFLRDEQWHQMFRRSKRVEGGGGRGVCRQGD